MMAVFTDGYIEGVFGPYPGNKNDATILNELLDTNIWSRFEAGDALLVDRGFRDSLFKISEKGFVSKMPHFSNTPIAPLTTTQANQSRLITKNRYIVEVLNGRIKKTFQCFDKTIQNTTIPYMIEDFRIACALINMTFKPPTTSSIDVLITERMLNFSNRNNDLSLLVREENLNARKSYF